MSKLVIVESPAKAKTISRFLGAGYDVQASFGHVRDLPESASDVPAELKKTKWGKLGVNIEGDFEPVYIVPEDKKRHVDSLKKAAKGATHLLLATDEDREGESISWHILELLKPGKKVEVSRIVFHEITPEAIQEALSNPRSVDQDLVKAQETRRVLDRLYGYTLSPVLWKKVAPKLSAGRVQSVAVRLCVDRERERARFRSAEYWDLAAMLGSQEGKFESKLTRVENKRVASGVSFDAATGQLKEDHWWLQQEHAEDIATRARDAKPWKVTQLEAKPGTESPPKPFTTSTLQQEAGRKLRYTTKRTMQIAQGLYEGIELGGERVGLITYMRTDSLNLADRALEQARQVIADLYGKEYLPASAVRYKTKAKGAQEAHEAIRPTDLGRRPADVKKYLSAEQFALYELIWKRTIACQMVPARVQRTTVEVQLDAPETLTFGASGKEILFPGFLRAYVEGSDDPDAELEGNERILPPLKVGQTLDLLELKALEHHTAPPARYTEASLIKKLEEEGIGRPSTYASIITTIQDRGYVFKRGNEMIPTWTAFAVITLLEENFADLVDLAFTARMEEELDEIAEGEMNSVQYLKKFFLGSPKKKGLYQQVEELTPDIPYPAIPLGDDPNSALPVAVRIGRFGPFLQRGEGGEGHRASVPSDLPPADLNIEHAIALLEGKAKENAALAADPATGKEIVARKGRFGDYLELTLTEEEVAAGEKPRRVSLPPGMKIAEVTPEDAQLLIQFPKHLGQDAAGQPVTVQLGRYGPFVKGGEELRNVGTWREALELTLEEAIVLLSQPKTFRSRGAATTRTPVAPLREFGTLEGAEGAVKVLDGRYGPYVTDGKTNATIPKGTTPEDLTPEEAMQLLLARKGQPKKVIRRNTRGKSRR